MDTLLGISGFINQFIEDNKYLSERSVGDSINTKALDQRQAAISQLASMAESLSTGLTKLRTLADTISRVQAEEVAALDNILGRVKKNGGLQKPAVKNSTPIRITDTVVQPQKLLSDQSWTLVQRKKPADIIKTERVPTARTLSPTAGGYERIKITQEITLNAIPIKSFKDVRCDGNLYYVTSCSHFAINIGGFLFHGNVGIIYTDSDEPQKIKCCKFTDGCNRMSICRYYHDPTIFVGSCDCRNYIASSFIYNSPSEFRNRSRARNFGSLEHLDADILGITDDEKNRIYDQTMHDLLCALVLKSLEPIKGKLI